MNSSTFRVLLIEDNLSDAILLKEIIKDFPGAPFEVTRCATRLSEAAAFLQAEQFDLILADLSLPDSSGMETFNRTRALAPELPVIVLSGMDSEELALKTVQEGAQDYLVKGKMDGHVIVRSMRYAIERKKIQHELAFERDLMHELLDNIPDRIYFKDKNSRFLRINRAMADFFGLERPQDAIGKTDFDFFLEDHARPAFECEAQVMKTGQPMVGLIEKETTPGGYIGWASTTKMPLHNEHGDIIGTFGISRDITKLKEMEDALDAERDLLRNLIDNIPDPVCLQDPKGLFVLDNLAHRKFLGAAQENEIIGKSPEDFVPKEVAKPLHEPALRVLRTGRAEINQEEVLLDASGGKHWVLSTRIPLRDDSGKVLGVVSIAREITEKKLAEEAIKKANADLTRTLGDLQKANEVLRETQLQLIEAEKLKSVGRLAAGVAHEVKNPLSIITMGLHYLEQQNVFNEPNAPMIIKEMADAVRRADAVIRGMLDFSAPKKLDIKAEDINVIIQDSLLLARVEMPNGEIELVTDFQKDLPRLNLDYMKISQVFVNLLTNAIHAMNRKGKLYVRSWIKSVPASIPDCKGGKGHGFTAGEKVVCVEVEDTGPGVPPDLLPKIFDPFFTTKQTGKGTGLGLAVVRSIIDLHGGNIEAVNRPEGGLKVTILFKI